MLRSNYLSVMQFQLKLEIKVESKRDVLVVTDEYYSQMEESIKKIKKLRPDICVFPEMSYQDCYNDVIKELSESGKLIIFGSTYVESVNKTHIYYDGKLTQVVKRYPCGSEPMIRFYEKIDVDKFINKYLDEHTFFVNGQKVYVLNCLEYYKVAYMIARNEKLAKDLFGFIVPCSNSNPKVFIEESKAIHNHNENIYSFISNRVKKNGEYGYGKSYTFGPIQYHEKDWLAYEGIMSEDHNSSIVTLDSGTPSYIYGRYAIPSKISRFGRSDFYINTPLDVEVEKII